jgi:hypothetical protein
MVQLIQDSVLDSLLSSPVRKTVNMDMEDILEGEPVDF